MPEPKHPNQLYCLGGTELNKVRKVMLELYKERRLNADEMRDLAQELQAVWDAACPYD